MLHLEVVSKLLKGIDKHVIEQYRSHRCKTVSNTTVNRETTVLLTLLNQAVEWDLLPDSYRVPRIKKLKEDKKPPRFLSQNEMKMLLDTSKEFGVEMYAYCMLMLYAGLRSGEALALRCEDVHLGSQNYLMVTPYETKNMLTGEIIKWTPKSHHKRRIPLVPALAEYLPYRLKEIDNSQFIVIGNGTFSAYRITRLFTDMIEKAGLPNKGEKKITAHTLSELDDT